MSVDSENIENDTRTILWMKKILSVFGAKTPFSNLSGLLWKGPKVISALTLVSSHDVTTVFEVYLLF